MQRLIFLLFIIISFSHNSFAGYATPWQTGFQEAFSPNARKIHETYDFVMIFMWIIVIGVLSVLGYICINFRAKKNPNPSKTTHHTLLEIIWIIIPTIIIFIIAVPSVKLILYQEKIPDYEMTLKIVGRQWYWTYEYPDHYNISFDSYMKQTSDLKEGDIKLLSTDNKIILPIQTNIKLQMTSSDVIHGFAIPSLGIKSDAIPGRLNESWVYIEKEGTYYGQCSELCGVLHSFMPIEIKAVSKEDFKIWVRDAKEKYSSLEFNIASK